MLVPINPNELFHVHTSRCGHASTQDYFEYIERAIEKGARKISFSDHSPFPGDTFGYRMSMEQLPEYLHTLNKLKKKYEKHIDVSIGLEIEFLPSYMDYYYQLKEMEGLDFLMIGQHFFEYEPGIYSFLEEERMDLEVQEAVGFTNAIVSGIKTGLFSYVAHPDRSFRRRKEWTTDLEKLTADIVNASLLYHVPIEKNANSIRYPGQYWKEFWDYANQLTLHQELPIVLGLDAHCTGDLDLKWK